MGALLIPSDKITYLAAWIRQVPTCARQGESVSMAIRRVCLRACYSRQACGKICIQYSQVKLILNNNQAKFGQGLEI